MVCYRNRLRSAGADTEFPGEGTLNDFMVWLRGEMEALEGYMKLGPRLCCGDRL